MNSSRGIGWLIVGLALGAAGIALLTRKHKDRNPWDVESVLRACDRAAERLDSLVREERTAIA